jgi:hypothetical protein
MAGELQPPFETTVGISLEELQGTLQTTASILGRVYDSLRRGHSAWELQIYLDLLQTEGDALQSVRELLCIRQRERQRP